MPDAGDQIQGRRFVGAIAADEVELVAFGDDAPLEDRFFLPCMAAATVLAFVGESCSAMAAVPAVRHRL